MGRQKLIWRDILAGKLIIWIGLIIYIGVFRQKQPRNIWRQDNKWPVHVISFFIPRKQQEQIKRYFHILALELGNTKEYIYAKIEPLTSALGKAFQRYVVPSSMVSINKIMVRFIGRSSYKIKIPGKPIPKGYKIISLC